MDQNFRRIVGSLNYLSTMTQLNITYAVSHLSQHLNKPGIKHWEAVMQVLRYLKGTKGLSLHCKAHHLRNCMTTIDAFVDADWANCADTRGSITGFVIMVDNNFITWRRRKQLTISLLTAQAKYQAFRESIKEILWMKNLTEETLGEGALKSPINLYKDNKWAIDLSNNNANNAGSKTKHIDLKFHFVKECVKNQLIKINHINSRNQTADFLTKEIGRTPLKEVMKKLQVLERLVEKVQD